jgi:general secretion pathway protein A
VSETGQYVAHRLQVAGAAGSIVAADAVPTLFELTRGIARQVNRLCDLALLVGFAEEQQTLSAAHFEAVCRELVAVVPE